MKIGDAKYRDLGETTPHVYFVGRLATYRYYNMDQAVGQAMTLYKKLAVAKAPKTHEPPKATTYSPALGRS